MYHSLDSSGSVTSITPLIFEAQMARLSELEYRVVSLRQAIAERQENGDWPDKSIVLTFDDGYANVHQQALPVLQRYGFSATVFVVSGHLDGINDWGHTVRCLGRQTMLSWNQVKDLADHGIEIGAHTLSHPDLSSLEPEVVEREIIGSVEEINSQLSEPVQTFAYPFGSISDEAVAVVNRTFRAACTTVHRRACDELLTLLPRIEMYYFRNQRDLQPLISGQLDSALTLRRWARRIRRFVPC
jgi:peptidoglycan/xylan/chitin deacetylase (PgdA/CDA1 family)